MLGINPGIFLFSYKKNFLKFDLTFIKRQINRNKIYFNTILKIKGKNMNPLFPSISIDITGPDGNAHVIMAIVSNCQYKIFFKV